VPVATRSCVPVCARGSLERSGKPPSTGDLLRVSRYKNKMSAKEIVFASTNDAKVREARDVCRSLGYHVLDLRGLSRQIGFEEQFDVLETELSYEGNARAKARAYASLLGRPCISDDTGLEIIALGGLPGVHTARFGIQRVSSMLLPEYRYDAEFVCCVSYAEPTGRSVSVTSRLEGYICFPREVSDLRTGLPFSTYFFPRGESETMEALSARGGFLTHRGRAIRDLITSISENYSS